MFSDAIDQYIKEEFVGEEASMEQGEEAEEKEPVIADSTFDAEESKSEAVDVL